MILSKLDNFVLAAQSQMWYVAGRDKETGSNGTGIETKDPFSYLDDGEITMVAPDVARSLYRLLMVIGVIGIAITLVWAFFRLSSKNGNVRQESKGIIVFKIVLALILCNALTIIGFIKGVFAGL